MVEDGARVRMKVRVRVRIRLSMEVSWRVGASRALGAHR